MDRVLAVHSGWSQVDLVLDEANPIATAQFIRSQVVHETTHMARFQIGYRRQEFLSNNEWSALDFVLNEGLALYAEEQLLGENATPNFYRHWSFKTAQGFDLRTAAAELLEDTSDRPSDFEQLYELLSGEASSPRRGYRVGHYLVSLVASVGYNLSQLIEMPFAQMAATARGLV